MRRAMSLNGGRPEPPVSSAECSHRATGLALSPGERERPRRSARTQAGTGAAALVPTAEVVETSARVVQVAPNTLSNNAPGVGVARRAQPGARRERR